jgi:hypothetical protein
MSSMIEKVRKLFAHAESAGQLGNQAEAEAFAQKASDLLIQHKIDASIIQQTDDTPDELVDVAELNARDIFGTKAAAGWRSALLNGLARAHFCRLVRTSTSTYALVGAASDREVVLYLLAQLLRVAPDMARRAVPEPLSYWKQTPRADRNAWLLGFASGIIAKLHETRQAAERSPYALVLVRAQDAADAKTRELFPQLVKRSAARSTGARSAFEAGREAGRSHNVSQGVRGSRGAAGHVTGGALRLGAGS